MYCRLFCSFINPGGIISASTDMTVENVRCYRVSSLERKYTVSFPMVGKDKNYTWGQTAGYTKKNINQDSKKTIPHLCRHFQNFSMLRKVRIFITISNIYFPSS